MSYGYDSVGNVTQIEQITDFDPLVTETQLFQYDELNRLRFWTLNDVTEEYKYDTGTGNLSEKNGLALSYPTDGTRPHAVTSAGVNTYGHDANGNQTSRTVGGQTLQLGYDAENRLVSVTGTNLSAQFTYNGDGQRVKSIINGETIYFVGGHYEVLNPGSGQTVTKYYFAGASRIAMRKTIFPQSDTLTYLLGDHLGSTSLAIDADTGDVIETRYKPWGEVRFTTQDLILPTRYTFTGQYSHMDDSATDLGAAGFGLMFYNARWYDPMTGHFAQADTIVPGGVQGLDRYAYGLNNPVRFVDPSGHKACDGSGLDGECDQSGIPTTQGQMIIALRAYGVKFTGHWDYDHVLAVYIAVYLVGSKLASTRDLGETDTEAFRAKFSKGVTFVWDEFCDGCREGVNHDNHDKPCGNNYTADGCVPGGGLSSSDGTIITFASMSGEGRGRLDWMIKNVVHELGHAFKHQTGDKEMGDSFNRNTLRPNPCDGCYEWQQHPGSDGIELFADTFIAWVFGAWNSDSLNADKVKTASDAMDNW